MSGTDKKPNVGVGVMILKKNKVLLGRRHSDPKKAGSELHGEGTWTMPGGKVHFGEKVKDAVFREVLEETGLRIDKRKLKIISVADDIVKDAHFVTIGFLYEGLKGKPKVLEPDKIVEWGWFDLNDPPSPLYFPSKKVLDKFLSDK